MREESKKRAAGSRVQWRGAPDVHDYPAALSYLALNFPSKTAKSLVKKLKRVRMSEFKAKDLFRASGLSLLGVSNSHVEKDRQKIAGGTRLSPLLLVVDRTRGKMVIADGYHRLCAVYTYDEDAVIPCKIVYAE